MVTVYLQSAGSQAQCYRLVQLHKDRVLSYFPFSGFGTEASEVAPSKSGAKLVKLIGVQLLLEEGQPLNDALFDHLQCLPIPKEPVRLLCFPKALEAAVGERLGWHLDPHRYNSVLAAVVCNGAVDWGICPGHLHYLQPPDEPCRLLPGVSHAVGKLSEAVEVVGWDMSQVKVAVDLGAAPGSWTAFLAGHADRVLAADPAALDDKGMQAQSTPRTYTWTDLHILDEVNKPIWIYSCKQRQNIWANCAALRLFTMGLDEFLGLDYREPSQLTDNEYNSFQTLNALIEDEVEIGGKSQSVECFGWKMLPGVCHANKALDFEIHFKPVRLTKDGQSLQASMVEAVSWQDSKGNPPLHPRLGGIMHGETSTEDGLYAATPIGKVLEVLEDIMAGHEANPEDIHALHELIVSGEFMNTQTRMAERMMNEADLEKDVGQNLMQLLGGQAKRRRSSASSLASDESMLSTRMNDLMQDDEGATSNLDSLELDPNMSVPQALLPAVESTLQTAGRWHFDAFQLEEATSGRPLSSLGFYLIGKLNLVREFDLDVIRLARFLRRVEDGYLPNPYHNKTHAADVLQSQFMLLTAGGLGRRAADPLILLAAVLSAIIHDLDHKGVNNDFLIRQSHELAIVYNDMSPLENHHLSEAFRIMRRKECNFLKRISKEKQIKLRKMMIEMVLGTDMKQHWTIMSRFQTKLQVKIHTNITTASASPDDSPFNSNSEADRFLVLQMGLKCADVGHLAAGWEVHKRWVACLEEELFLQGDQERALHVNVSPLMDRSKNGITKSQVGFFDLVAVPLFRSWCAVFNDASPMLKAVESNRHEWRKLESAGSLTKSSRSINSSA
ncbi:hypothetical protein WJX84_002829 [Apatococcus fuscideae]|uniref:Phosphodiesterase n=1 Tax=Apatococcus fuscideae TaxID=2026836 RepID=A0AAW1S0Q1_9CHLO